MYPTAPPRPKEPIHANFLNLESFLAIRDALKSCTQEPCRGLFNYDGEKVKQALTILTDMQINMDTKLR